MKFSSLISELLSSTEYGTLEKNHSAYTWISNNKVLYISDPEKYNNILEKIYLFNKDIQSRFSRKTVFKKINENIPAFKESLKEEILPEEFFEDLLAITSRNLTIFAPISGIRLNDGVRKFSLPPYIFGYLNDIDLKTNDENGIYIGIEIKHVYDESIAISKAENSFHDFARLISFISGKLDHSIFISTGLPLMPSYTHELMFVRTTSYQISDGEGNFSSASLSNKFVEKVPINDSFFCNNKKFHKLWELNERNINGPKLSDIESRLINSAIALGESALTLDRKNSIIYTCISLEIMFSHDERDLFQRSIGEKLSDLFTFVVAKDRETRLSTSKIIKKVYGMRSAIVHGGNKELTAENLFINILMRSAISELINNEKFKNLKKIDDLSQMLRDAQNSY